MGGIGLAVVEVEPSREISGEAELPRAVRDVRPCCGRRQVAPGSVRGRVVGQQASDGLEHFWQGALCGVADEFRAELTRNIRIQFDRIAVASRH